MGREDFGQFGFDTAHPIELGRVSKQAQVPIAIRFYHEAHPDKEVNLGEPLKNPKNIRDTAALEWAEKHGEDFESYVSKHQKEMLDMNDPVALDRLYQAVMAHSESLGRFEEKRGPAEL